MNFGGIILSITGYFQLGMYVLAALAGIVCLIHAFFTRPDAFTAVDAKSRGFWVGVLAAAIFGVAFGQLIGGPFSLMIFIVALVAILVYLVDVRPRVDEVQGKSWFRKVA